MRAKLRRLPFLAWFLIAVTGCLSLFSIWRTGALWWEHSPQRALRLGKALQVGDTKRRREAAQDLARMKRRAAPATDALLSRVRDPDEEVSDWCALALASLAAGDPALQDSLVAIVLEEPGHASFFAGNALAHAAPSAVERISQGIQSANAHSVALVLGQFGYPGTRELIHHAVSTDPAVAREAVDALRYYVSDEQLATDLDAALKDSDPSIGEAARCVRVQVDEEEARMRTARERARSGPKGSASQ